ncbi:hypothetical protein PG994_014730 [Apiospora phragmitis]|uniref:Uncharacterized protein n=1 Tax=Apiospora phragmitis TaxID=2905665 RepID=A0ABR1SUF1_9PEZI
MPKYLSSSHQPDLTKAAIVGTAAAERVVEPFEVIKWQIGTKFKYWHTPGETTAATTARIDPVSVGSTSCAGPVVIGSNCPFDAGRASPRPLASP